LYGRPFHVPTPAGQGGDRGAAGAGSSTLSVNDATAVAQSHTLDLTNTATSATAVADATNFLTDDLLDLGALAGGRTPGVADITVSLNETMASGGYYGSNFTLGEVTCFLPGTRIAVPGGEIPVETLRPGDMVCTVSGVAPPPRWVGFGRTLITPRNRDRATPAAVCRHGLGEYVPRQPGQLTLAALSVTRTAVPVSSESDGLRITESVVARPDSTSTRSP
jgi:hypothetical protein